VSGSGPDRTVKPLEFAPIKPASALFSKDLREFILSYD
jgi:hypothetical protein